MTTPPGVSDSDFKIALGEFARAIGDRWVFTSDEDVALYRDAYSPLQGEATERVASAAVAPSTLEEVQAIVRIANRRKIPLYTISTGRNLTYGGSAPVYSGSVVLDLKRMNRIIEVDERAHYCLVEPGVSFFDLFAHIRERGLNVRVSVPDPGWGSPIGNALEHGVGNHVYRDHFASHCGMEVVLANGEVVRTGMGAMPGAQTWQRFRYGFGPSVDGIFAQSNFGVVTKMGFHMLPEPDVTRFLDVSVAGFDTLDAFLEEMQTLQDSGVLNCNGALTCPLLSMAIPDSRTLLEKPGGASAREWDALGARLGIAPWRIRTSIPGPEKVVQALSDHMIDRLSRLPGFKIEYDVSYRRGYDPDKVPNRDKGPMGIPSLQIFANVGVSRRPGHTDFSPAYPMNGESVRKVNAVLQKAFAETGLPWPGWYGGNYWFPKTLLPIISTPVSYDPVENKKFRAAFEHLMDAMAAAGYGEYRTHTLFQDRLMSKYNYNNGALLRLHETLKDAIDPNGILAAGKNGIWPKHLRTSKV